MIFFPVVLHGREVIQTNSKNTLLGVPVCPVFFVLLLIGYYFVDSKSRTFVYLIKERFIFDFEDDNRKGPSCIDKRESVFWKTRFCGVWCFGKHVFLFLKS